VNGNVFQGLASSDTVGILLIHCLRRFEGFNLRWSCEFCGDPLCDLFSEWLWRWKRAFSEFRYDSCLV